MSKLLVKCRLGIIVLIWGAICAKIAEAKWYDISSKLSVFQNANSHY